MRKPLDRIMKNINCRRIDLNVTENPTNSTTSLHDRCQYLDPIQIRKRPFSLMQTKIIGGGRAND